MRDTLDCNRVLAILVTLISMILQSGCDEHLAGRPKRIQLVENDKLSQFEQSLVVLEDRYDDPNMDDKVRQNARDTYVRKIIAVIDKRYHDFLDVMIGTRKGFDATTDITAIGLDTASVLFTPVTTKSILSGLSGLTTAGKTSINKVYFYEQALPALVSQMEADRQAVLADIIEGLKTHISAYPLYQAQRDLNRYYMAGTIDGALTEIQKHAAQKSEEAQERIRKDVEDQLEAGRLRWTKAMEYMKDQSSFDKMREAIKDWWMNLDEDAQWEQIDIIIQWAQKRGIPVEKLETDQKVQPNHFPELLDTLKYNEDGRMFLADIFKNSAGIELPR